MQKKLINFLILQFIIIFPTLLNSNNFNFDILGCFCEGGMIYGIVSNGEQVKINDLKMKLSNDNYFVYAFGRKHDEIVKIKIGKEEKIFRVKKKKYKIEKINNLPTRKVEPSQKDMKKILKESDELKKVKNLDINNKLFSDQFLIPVEGRISGRFGSQRILNGKAKRPHYGLDIAAKKGTKIYAPTDGKIKKVFDNMFFTGNTIIIDHGLGLISIFAHLEKIFISENQLVSKGDLVGSVGMTGRATGPHLHWGIYLQNIPVDPEIFIDLNVLE